MTEARGYINMHTHHLHPGGHFSLYNYIVRDGSEKIPGQPFSAGIHPWNVNNAAAQQVLLEKISGQPHCLAIGETGLDHDCKTPMDVQENIFRFQCRLAVVQKKPLVLHVVKSHFEVIKILQQEGIQKAFFHGYNNRYTILEKVIESGYHISIGAAVMNGQSPAAALIGQIPARQLLLETDESHFTIEDIYATAAEKRKTSVKDLQEQISQNFKQLFS